MSKYLRAIKGKPLYAVVDKQGMLLHRAGTVSIFHDKKMADFLAYEWSEPEEELDVIKVNVQKK